MKTTLIPFTDVELGSMIQIEGKPVIYVATEEVRDPDNKRVELSLLPTTDLNGEPIAIDPSDADEYPLYVVTEI